MPSFRQLVAIAAAAVIFFGALLVSGCERSFASERSVEYPIEFVEEGPLREVAAEDREKEIPRTLFLQLPTSNDALLRGDEGSFYQALPTTIPGLRRFGWEGGRYGIVRNQARTPSGLTFTRLHQGVDIKPVYRDRQGEPRDTVRAIDRGVVAYVNNNASGSNYGRYVVVRHDWDGSDVYVLMAHLATVGVRAGQEVAPGAPIGRMGYTGRGINRERAHLHMEIALMVNRHYNQFHSSFYRGRNLHGLFFGRNLVGVDPSALYLALQFEPSITFSDFVRRQPVAYRLAIPGNRPLDVLERYPWLGEDGVTAADRGNDGAWIISFTREGVPVAIDRQDERVSSPQVIYVADEVRQNHLSTAGILARTANGYTLTRNGLAFAAHLATGSDGTPRWY